MAITLSNNAYYTGLTNLALFLKMYNVQTSGKLENFVNDFTTESITYGDTKIFRTLPLPEVKDYSKNSTLLQDATASINIGTTEQPDIRNVIEDTLTINIKKVIASSYTTEILNAAVTNEAGASRFVAITLDNMDKAKLYYKYNTLIDKIFTYTPEKASQTVEISIYDTDSATSIAEKSALALENQKIISLEMQTLLDSIQTDSNLYNGYGLTQALSLSDLRMVICEPYKTKAVLDLFAELLNSNYISENMARPELKTIPKVKVKSGSELVVGYIMHKQALQLFESIQFLGNFFDPCTLRINNFLHFWFCCDFVKQLPLVKIKVKKDLPIPAPATTD